MKKQTLPITYPFNWNGLENFNYPRDTKGLPQVYMGKNLGLRYNPVTIAQYGLYCLQKYATSNDETELKIAQAASAWLIENFSEWKGDIGAWVYDYDMDFYCLKASWISGMAQGQSISLLLRIHQLTPNDQILEITQRAFRAFLHPVSEGGVTAYFPDGSPIFEEFTTEPPSLVLNGYIFALIGIFDYANFYQNSEARDLFKVAIEGLKKNLYRYDTGYWNLYDLHPTRRLASPMYVKVHVQLLRILTNFTEEKVFEKTAEKWQKYLSNPTSRFRWLTEKILEKIRVRFYHLPK